MKIPIANIYYLLAYAWDKLGESRLAPVDAEACKTPLELLARVLIGGTSYLLKKGLDRNYREVEETIPAIKGKLLVSESVKSLVFHRSKAICRYDVFNHDVLHNQILKTMLNRICRIESLEGGIKRDARSLYLRFHEVNEVVLTKQIFSKVHLHRNNRFYGFLLNVCELLYDNLLPDEQSGKYRFQDFLRDDRQMAILFEAFVRNFYKRELPAFYKISRDDIHWQFSAVEAESIAFLPVMKTDIILRTANRKIIIDTKFYREVLSNHYGKPKFRREHLSQIYSYLNNQVSENEPISLHSEGMLLYASTGSKFNHTYEYGKHQLSIRSVDLSRDWRDIREELLGCLG